MGKIVGLAPCLLVCMAACEGCPAGQIQGTLPFAPPPTRSVTWQPPAPGSLAGVADLHAHPAIHLAFRGNVDKPGLYWGDPGTTATWPGDLPDVPACDPETHSADLKDQVTRAGRARVLSLLGATTQYPHSAAGAPKYENWPNGRDVYHNGMHIQSIRRAYEGGLRLMVASASESQTLGEILSGTIFPGPSRASLAREREAAERQLRYLRSMVDANSDWMRLCTTPEQAEAAIRDGRLAVLLGLEMDMLPIDDTEDLIRRYGVATVVPIHLVDNAVGGTAAFNDIFNANTALMGRLIDTPDRYISVEQDPLLKFRFGYPLSLKVTGPSYDVGALDHSKEKDLHYNTQLFCDPPSVGVPYQFGHRNTVGVRDASAIRRLMKLGVMVDTAHMGVQSTADTIDLAKTFCDYPLINSHTGVRPAAQPGFSERALYAPHAQWMADHGGIIGLGTEGRTARTRCADGTAPPPIKGSARGGPAVVLTTSGTTIHSTLHGVVDFGPGQVSCEAALPAGLQSLTFTAGGPAPQLGTAVTAVLEITYVDGHREQVELRANAPIGRAGDSADITSIELRLLDRALCQTPKASPALTLNGATLNATTSGGMPFTRALSGTAAMGPQRAAFQIYRRCPVEDVGTCSGPAGPERADDLPPAPADGPHDHYVRLRVRSGNLPLKGGSSLRSGAVVYGLVCTAADKADCVSASAACGSPRRFPIVSGAAWPAQTEFSTYVRLRDAERAEDIVAVAFCLDQRDLQAEPWEADEIAIEAVEDPVRAWAADYARLQADLYPDAGSPDGGFVRNAIALGTDTNGLYPQFHVAHPILKYGAASGCGTRVAEAGEVGDGGTGGVLTLNRPLWMGGTELCFEDRGLGTYGLLPEVFATAHHYDGEVYQALFRSAWATIQTWRESRARAATCATGGP